MPRPSQRGQTRGEVPGLAPLPSQVGQGPVVGTEKQGMADQNWKEVLGEQIPDERRRDIEIFAGQVGLRRQNKLDEKVFAETRLRWGIYGQRYDNGQRYDGTKTQTLTYPAGDLTKGPNTLWDAPGMQRIKIPSGGSCRSKWKCWRKSPTNIRMAFCTSPPGRTSNCTTSTSKTRPT